MIGHKDFPSRSGGVEVMVGGLARSLVERGYDVTVYNRGLEKHHNVYDVDGVHARRVFTLQKPSLNATIYSFLATFDALFRGYDVIHYHAIGPSVPLLIAKLFGKHTVCTVHGLNWKVDKWRGFASRYMKLGERIAAKYADDLVVLSETEWNYFLQKYGRASILIPNAIRFYEKRACSLIREKYGLARGEYILYVGRISPEKGPLDLVEGYPRERTLFVGLLFVDLDLRRQGTGRTIVDAAVQAADRAGFDRVRLACLPDNGGGRAFWESMGFRDLREGKLLESGDPVWIMERLSF